MPIAAVLKKPFSEQIAYFREKLALPSAAWDDIAGAAHDRAFMVAGAQSIDLLADPMLGLGQLDDLAVIALGLRLFISLCPPALVEQYQRRFGGARVMDESEVVDTTYRVVDDQR